MTTHRSLRFIQTTLQDYYGLEHGPDVNDFVSFAGGRETLLVRESDDTLELALVLPEPATQLDGHELQECSDTSAQFIEGVSHFVYLVERARTELPATQLELELQAEIDKFVFFALSAEEILGDHSLLHSRLYEHVHFLHPAGTELGDRYRMASSLAARFVARLNSNLTTPAVRTQLRRFYRLGQTEKLSAARAA